MTTRLARLAFALVFLPASQSVSAQSATVVIIVRHAERAPGSGDPPISEVGRARAAALAETGRAAGVSVIVTTQLQRTKQTAAPLAESLGITPEVVATQSDLAKHAAEIAATVRRQAGRTILVVGHSNTVPAIVAALGGPKVPDFCEPEYDGLYTMILDAGGAVRTVRTRFGAPTPVDASCATMR